MNANHDRITQHMLRRSPEIARVLEVCPPDCDHLNSDEPKPQERGNLPREKEIEKIKRQLHHLIDRVDALKTK